MAQITRSNAETLIPTQVMGEIMQGVTKSSTVLSLFRKLPNMTSNKTEMKVLDLLPVAYWQTSDTATKNLTKMAWANKFIYAEEIAVIVPIAEAVLDDADYDIWGEVKPRLIEAFGKKIDQAIIAGIDKPAKFRADLLTSVRNAGAAVSQGSKTLYETIAGEGGLMSKVELSGYNPTGMLGGVELKAKMRMLLDGSGNLLTGTAVNGLTQAFVDNGAWDATKGQMIVGDFNQAVYSIRQDITFKFLDQAVIQDPATGEILYNLAQNDMVALRCVMRLGWEIPNPINALNDTETRFPFALLEPTTAATTYNVTFTVKDDATAPAAVTGAKVTLAGQDKKTTAGGTAVFKSNGSETLLYKVSKEGYKTVYGEIEVGSTATSVSVTLPKA